MINILYLAIAFITDILLGIFFPTSFVGIGISSTANVTLIALILITYKQNRTDSLLLAFFVGLFFDLYNFNTLFAFGFIYLITVLIVTLWTTRINDSFIELFFVTLSAIFVKEFLLYIFNVVSQGYILNLNNWALSHLSFTLIFSLIPILISVTIKLNVMEKSSRIQRKMKKSDFINHRT